MTEPFGPLPSLRGTRWALVEVGGKPVEGDAGERSPHLVLDAAEPCIAGSTGCNGLEGSFELDGGSLRFGPVATTMMACPEEVMAREQAFLDALEATRAFVIEGSSLALSDGKRVLARLEAAHEIESSS